MSGILSFRSTYYVILQTFVCGQYLSHVIRLLVDLSLITKKPLFTLVPLWISNAESIFDCCTRQTIPSSCMASQTKRSGLPRKVGKCDKLKCKLPVYSVNSQKPFQSAIEIPQTVSCPVVLSYGNCPSSAVQTSPGASVKCKCFQASFAAGVRGPQLPCSK